MQLRKLKGDAGKPAAEYAGPDEFHSVSYSTAGKKILPHLRLIQFQVRKVYKVMVAENIIWNILQFPPAELNCLGKVFFPDKQKYGYLYEHFHRLQHQIFAFR